MKKYKLNLPKGYRKKTLPGLTEWVKALRSGRYKQGNYQLCSIENGKREYCCLGVRLQIQKQLKINGNEGFDKFGNDTDVEGFSENNPDFKIFDKMGMFPEGVDVTIETEKNGEISFSSLAGLNDEANFNFNEIADVLEKLYKEKV